MDVTSENIRTICLELGADLVGIASIDRFSDAPLGFHPCDILSDCKTVIVLACRLPHDALNADAATYTLIRNQMVEKMDNLATSAAAGLKTKGLSAKPILSVQSQLHNGKYYGPISLKHAAVLAGLGQMGKNTLLINENLGNMLWLSAVLINAAITPDATADYQVCNSSCNLCLEACPVSALEPGQIQQLNCFKHAFKFPDGKLQLQCWSCRKICPYKFGIKRE
jgi:epoxyqueuosine reductase QueG